MPISPFYPLRFPLQMAKLLPAMKHAAFITGSFLCVLAMGLSSGCIAATVETEYAPCKRQADRTSVCPDVELARLLVRLELRTRGVIAAHYGGADQAHRSWLAENLLLPAAVADKVFHETVPAMTGNRAWVKMVVDEPRNPHNAGDDTAMTILATIKDGAP